jgi:hypothetical protein
VFFRQGDDTYVVVVPDELRQILVEGLAGLRARLQADTNDPALQRLFPTAYNQDDRLDEEYQRLMRSELLESRLATFDTVERTLDRETATADELHQWLQAINALRLVLGTMLDVSEEPKPLDPDDPDFAERQLYDVLTYVLYAILEALNDRRRPGFIRRRLWPR